MEYRFVGLFPLSLNSTRVQYGTSQVLKATASFSYDRYIAGESSSLSRDLGRAFNDIGAAFGNPNKDGATSYGDNDRFNSLMRETSRTMLNFDGSSFNSSMTGTINQTVESLGGGELGRGFYP